MSTVRIRRSFDRPDAALLEHFRGVGSGQVVDAMDRTGGMDASVRAVACNRPVAGTALTVEAAPHDVLAIYAALAISRPGDIIVAATGDYRGTAVLGSVMAGFMRNSGIGAFVTDAPVRDSEEIKKLDFPVFAAGLSPNAPQKNGPGAVGIPIVVGNRTIESGDIIVADLDGVAVVPAAHINAAIAALTTVLARERDLERIIGEGTKAPDWLKAFMNSEHVAFID